ncbi:MAG: iron export ABC transporter permease subunit FetB [Proteobacteria bacterium]|nr:iron export ABC transporter permease subunit FetB [Pseudomonadota bacterium]
MTGAIPIGPWELALASGFLLVAAGLSLVLSLGVVRGLLWAGARAYVQLIALGWVLRWVFGLDSPWVVLGILALMMLFGTQTLLARVQRRPPGLFLRSLVAISFSGFTVTFAVTALVIRVEPWYEPSYVIPIAGMVVGNSMSGMAICLERLFGDLRARSAAIESLLALGARPWEAARPSARAAFRAGLIPTLNAMGAAGVVFIPGMMTGQVLAGTDPRVAAAYQIVILLMIAAATAIGAAVAVVGGYRKAFDPEERFLLGPAGERMKSGS